MKKKTLVSLGLVSIILVSMTIGAFAASNLQEIKAYLNKGLKVKLNGEIFIPKDASGNVYYPITYNGSTYLPVRAVGEAVGLKVGFDSTDNAVLLGEASATTGATTSGLSRSNPAAIGTTVKFTKKDIFDDYEATFRVDQVIRGDEAWTMVQAGNPYNDAPAAGYEYMMVKLTFGITKNAQSDAQVNFYSGSFTMVSTAGKDYDNKSASFMDTLTSIDADLYVGAFHTGWEAFLVKIDDATPLLAYGRSYDGTGGVWFKTN